MANDTRIQLDDYRPYIEMLRDRLNEDGAWKMSMTDAVKIAIEQALERLVPDVRINRTRNMKIKISKERITHYQAICHGCEWVENDHHDREWVRQEVAKHIRKTRHSVSIEKGTSTLYEAAEHPLHSDGGDVGTNEGTSH